MQGCSDESGLAEARQRQAILVSLDADFHHILATTGVSRPSVIRIRMDGLALETLAELLIDVIQTMKEPLEQGVAMSVLPHRVRYRKLPLSQ